MAYQPVTPVYENTTMDGSYMDGVLKSYRISPIDGYVLHDNTLDWDDEDQETGEVTHVLGYTKGSSTMGVNYNFVANPREFYAVPENSVPADQIFGGGNNEHEHEVM
jgi:hypothetical protein